jgi:hypothetical protein
MRVAPAQMTMKVVELQPNNNPSMRSLYLSTGLPATHASSLWRWLSRLVLVYLGNRDLVSVTDTDYRLLFS